MKQIMITEVYDYETNNSLYEINSPILENVDKGVSTEGFYEIESADISKHENCDCDHDGDCTDNCNCDCLKEDNGDNN